METDYFGIGAMAGRLKDGVFEAYHLDHLGNRVAATDANGNVVWREDYTPFGERLTDPSAKFGEPDYTGHVYDQRTGLTYMQARHFDPVIGRFLSTDPIGYQDQFNLYAYVANDPVNKIDPDGMVAQIVAKQAVKKTVKRSLKGRLTSALGSAEKAEFILDIATAGSPAEAAGVVAGALAGKAGDAVKAVRAGKKADFKVNSDGAAVRNSTTGARADLNAAGLEGKKISNRSGTETGTIHTSPGQKTDIRIMDGGPNHGPRAVTTRQGTKQPVNAADGSNFGNVPKSEQRQRNHIKFDDPDK